MKAKSTQFLQAMFQEHNSSLVRFLSVKVSNVDEAEDLAQDAYHNLLRSSAPEKLENAKAYLFQTAANLAHNRLRKLRRQSHYEQHLATESRLENNESVTHSTEQTISAQYDLESVLKAVDKLPKNCRTAFLLSRSQDKSYKEISEIMGVSISTIEKYIIHALNELRKELS